MTEPLAISENQRGELLLTEYVRSITTGGGKPGSGFPAVIVPTPVTGRGRADGETMELGEPDIANSLRSEPGGHGDMILNPTVFHATQDPISSSDVAPNFGATSELGVHAGLAVRRLTPIERERLQGWADGHTEWGLDEDGNRVEMSVTARNRMTGNGVASPVAAWIASRLVAIHVEPTDE